MASVRTKNRVSVYVVNCGTRGAMVTISKVSSSERTAEVINQLHGRILNDNQKEMSGARDIPEGCDLHVTE